MVNVMVYQMVFIVGKQLLVPMAWQGILNGSDKKGFLHQMDKVGFGGGAPEQKINFCLKWSNTWVGHFGGPQSEKKAHHQVSCVWPACRTPKRPLWNINIIIVNIFISLQSKISYLYRETVSTAIQRCRNIYKRPVEALSNVQISA